MRNLYLITVITIGVAVATTGCSCASGRKAKALIRDSGERWVLVGDYTTPRENEGPPKENYIGTVQLPDGELVRLVDLPIKTPDGQNVGAIVAYSEPRRVMVCLTSSSGLPTCNDVWRYDLATGQTRWIAKGKWNNTRGFAWSPDGSKVAFVASTRGEPAAYVMQYDLDTEQLEKVADDAFGNRDDQQEGNSSSRPRRPVYSEDGKHLYFVSMDQNVMRVDLSTRQLTKLPFVHAIVVLTVKGQHLIYAREVGARDDWRFEIVKVRLDSPDSPAGKKILHAAHGVIWGSYVSPSRRFILVRSRAGYGSETRLIDMDQSVSLPADGLLWRGGLRAHSTVFVGGSP